MRINDSPPPLAIRSRADSARQTIGLKSPLRPENSQMPRSAIVASYRAMPNGSRGNWDRLAAPASRLFPDQSPNCRKDQIEMPNLIEKTKDVKPAEYTYRDRIRWSSPRQPAAGGCDRHAQRDQLRPALPARDGGLAGPLRALRRRDPRRDPARPARRIGPATTGTSASTACPRSSATATGSTAPRATATATTRASSCSTRTRGPSRAAGPGELAGNLPRRSLMTESMIDRQRDGAIPARRWKTRSSTSCTSAGFTDRPQLGRPASRDLSGPGREDRLPRRSWGSPPSSCCPIDEFDENDCPFVNPLTGEKLRNFWGYNTIAFGAPKAAYASNPERCAPWHEFCEMVDVVPRSGHRGLPRRRLQPHRRGGRGRPDLQLPRPRQHALLHARRARAAT